MNVFVNNKLFDCESAVTVEQVLQKTALSDTRGVAVAVNNVVIPKNDWNNFPLKENDRLVVIKATQGG
ncbi:MAG TPA: sulfur carrier protein ThiS [Bacteroidia bacterium]